MRVIMMVGLTILLVVPAQAEPWIVTGQTRFSSFGRIINPEPNTTGAMGEVLDLPYTVPPGKMLCIEHYAIEGYDDPGIVVLFMYTGTHETDIEINKHSTVSVAADGGSSQLFVNYCWPGGTLVNVVLLNGTQGQYVHGWHIVGDLTVYP